MEGSERMSAGGDAHPPFAAVEEDRIGPLEAEALRRRRQEAGIETAPDGSTPTVGLALSGGGIRSATFCLGLLRGLARQGVLRRFDYLSTVSGGGYTGAMFGKLVAEVGIEEAENIMARSDSLPLSWLRRYGRYLAPRGARDYGMGIATYLRAIVAVHLEFAFLALTLGLLAVSVHAAHQQSNLFVVDGWNRWPSAWWPLAVGFWLVTAPGLQGVYWMLRDTPPAADSGWRPLRFRAWDAAVIAASLAAGVALLNAWLSSGPLPLPGPSWGLLAGLIFFGLGVCGLGLVAHLLFNSARDNRTTIANARRQLTGALRWANFVAVSIGLLGLLDWVSWELRGILWTSASGMFSGLGVGGVLLVGLRAVSEPMQKWTKSNAGSANEALPMLINAVGFGIAFALVVLWTTLAQWLIFDGSMFASCPSLLPDGLCAFLIDTSGAGTFGRWGLLALFLLIWFVFTGTNTESANTSSLHNMYSARLVRAYLGAANPSRFDGDLRASAVGTSPEVMSDVTEVNARDDVDLQRYDPAARGGPIHLINVCLNQTRGHRSGLYNADRKGVPLVASAYGMEVGQRHIGGLASAKLGSLGRWVAISGAAASPGAGAYTTPGWAALLFLVGMRLGYWFDAGDASASLCTGKPKPRKLRAWLHDAFNATKMGRLHAEFRAIYEGPLARAWYLSDGGHFENTGVHALLQRQLDVIVLADCSADPRYELGDLENLVRKARIDFGAEIEFYTAEHAEERFGEKRADDAAGAACEKTAGGTNSKPISFLSPEKLADNFTARGVLLARILYRADAQGRRKQGSLLVVKPNLHEALDIDILAYARRNPLFPQQSMGDQFFDEAQWESYHRLGEDFGSHLRGDWLARLTGWSAVETADEPERIRACRLKAPAAAPDTDRPFWRINAKDAAVGALSLGALLAVIAPAWQVVETWRTDRAQARVNLVSAVAKVEAFVEGVRKTPGRPATYEEIFSIVELRNLSAEADDGSIQSLAAAQLLAKIDAECSNQDAAARLITRDVCDQLKPRAWMQDRQGSEYWALRVPGEASPQSSASASASSSAPAAARGRPQPVPPAPIEQTPVQVESVDSKPRVVDARDLDAPDFEQRDDSAAATGIRRDIASASGIEPSAEVAAAPVAGDANRVKARCARPARNAQPVRVYVQVYDEVARARMNRIGWDAIWPRVSMPGIENVAITAFARNAQPPEPHPVPTLIVHRYQRDRACAEALADWLAEQPEIADAGMPRTSFRVRALPKGFKAQDGVIELWWPPQMLQTSNR